MGSRVFKTYTLLGSFYRSSSLIIYKGDEFKEVEWKCLITSLKDQSLRRIVFKNNQFIKEEIILKNKIGRIRDIELDPLMEKFSFK